MKADERECFNLSPNKIAHSKVPFLYDMDAVESSGTQRSDDTGSNNSKSIANEHVTIVVTKKEWNESSNAMRILMQFAQKEKEKETSLDILKGIDTLYKNIFSKGEKQAWTKENDLDADVYNKIKDLTSNEFSNILDQIKQQNDNKNNEENETLEKKFCESFNGFSDMYERYKIKSLPSIVDNYRLMYQDFLSISSQLIDNNLKQLLLKHSNNEQDVDFLYNKIIIRKRNACSLLPFKHCSSDWDYMYGEDYIRMINRFSSSKNDELKMFCILYNCIASIFVAGNSGSQTGFDKYIREYVDQGDELSALCESHILVEMVKTGIFGNDAKLIDEKSYHYGKGVYSSKIVSFIISNIFDNDLTSLKKFLKYCVIDIQQNNNITKLKSIYTLNDEANRGHYGISFYVLNRLTYVLYHDLLCMNMKRNNELLFPSLIKFYKFLYNFAVYCHCHTHIGVVEGDTKQKKEYELFYMKEYHRLKNTTYSISKQINIELHRFNYYCGNKFDGSILHCAVYNNFVGYVQLLLKGGFDPSMQNKYYLRQYRTPISIAKTTKKVLMVSLLQEAINSEKKENKENKEDEEKEAEMDMRSLTLRYDSFTNSFMSSIYFLKCLGFNDIYQTIDAKLKMNHELVGKEDSYDNCYWDDFACQMENLIGLKISDSSTSNNNTSGQSDAMVLVVACVESLIKLKMSLSIDLVILACIYSNYCNNYKFFDTLQSTIIECLNGNDNDYKTRNYQWFKHFILNSNVWLVKLPIAHKNQNVSCKDEEKTGQTTTDTAGDVILFDTVVVDVNKLLMKQKEYIWDNVEKIRNDKETNLTFEKLCNFGVNGINTRKELRQDKITNGIMSSVSEFELLLQKVEMGLSAHSSFDLKFENNTKTYLTQCLAFAHANNNTLQSEMKEYFGNKLKIKCKYASAPVKLGNRCIVKATSDYGQKEYPSCANILDFLRFSVTFDNINDLLNGLNTFVNDINQGNVISCVLPNSVLRIKNGFNDILNKWKSVNDASYVDLKLNIVYENIITKQCMIIEAQFLLLFLLKAKKMGHKYYSIVRQEELINNIKNQVYVIDNDNKKYKRKIETFVHNHDSGALMKQLFWKPHVVFSIIVDGGSGFNHFYPLFSEICRQFGVINGKFVLFFLNCLFFHSFVMLDQDDNENNKFLKKYFNWGNGHYTVGGVHTLYHIPLSSIVSSSVQSSIVNLILGKKYLKVLTFNGSHRNNLMVHNCIFEDKNLYYLSLMSKYIKTGDVCRDFHDKLDQILTKLFDPLGNTYYLNNLSKFLEYFLQICKNGDSKLSKKAINKALTNCVNQECTSMLNQYLESQYQ